jgi:hypothetical protein
MERFLLLVAGIDRETLDDCPRTDRILARQLGVMLTLTFLIIATITFYSLTYINGSTTQYDVTTNSFHSENVSSKWYFYALYGSVAVVIALVITLFDRMIYQSDWFYQIGISEARKLNISSRARFLLSKVFRITIRLAISVGVAYALSTFLELKVFESQIVKRVQELYLDRNEPVFEDIRSYAETLSSRIADKRGRIDTLRAGVADVRGAQPLPDESLNARLAAIEQELSGLEAGSQLRYEQLRSRQGDETGPIIGEAEALRAELARVEEEVARFRDRRNAEAAGINPEDLEGISGLAGCFERCEYWQAKLDAAVARRQTIQERLGELDARLRDINERYAQLISETDSTARERVQALTEERDGIYAEARSDLTRKEEKRDARLEKLEADIAAGETSLSGLEASYLADLDSYTDRRQAEPDYVPFSDGPLDRLTALLDLKAEAVYGPTISWFSWWVKGFVIFLEVVPVISKMFFSPPSVYGFRIRSFVEAGQAEQINLMSELANLDRVAQPQTQPQPQPQQEPQPPDRLGDDSVISVYGSQARARRL